MAAESQTSEKQEAMGGKQCEEESGTSGKSRSEESQVGASLAKQERGTEQRKMLPRQVAPQPG